MVKIFNKIFSILKLLLLVASFVLSLYIMLNMYESLEKDPFGKDFMEFIGVLIPFFCLLIVYVINITFKQKSINDNIFYNITCFIILLTILYMGIRSLMDSNLVLWHKTAYHINFDYFADQIFQIKAMLFGLFVTDILLIIEGKLSKKKELEFTE